MQIAATSEKCKLQEGSSEGGKGSFDLPSKKPGEPNLWHPKSKTALSLAIAVVRGACPGVLDRCHCQRPPRAAGAEQWRTQRGASELQHVALQIVAAEIQQMVSN